MRSAVGPPGLRGDDGRLVPVLGQFLAASGPAGRTEEVTADHEVVGEESAGTARNSAGALLVLVVGFDGSQPAQRALQTAERLLDGGPGWLEVVYVARRRARSPSSDAGASELDRGYERAERINEWTPDRMEPAWTPLERRRALEELSIRLLAISHSLGQPEAAGELQQTAHELTAAVHASSAPRTAADGLLAAQRAS